ncbi:MAG: DUF6279 family lipoprotein [Pseudomonadota bacterium]
MLFRWLIFLPHIIIISGCTSVIAIGTAYDAAAGQFRKELLSYADFNTRQEREIRNRVAAFHQWHRSDQLPRYLALMQQITTALDTPAGIRREDVGQWSETFSQFTGLLGSCSPMNHSGEFLQTLSDRQVRQIAVKIRDRHIQRVKEYQSQTTAERLKERQKLIAKWAGRAGVKLNSEQKVLVERTLQKQISLSPQRHELWQRWSDQLISKLNKRGGDTFTTDINEHIESLWKLTERSYPQQWQDNIALWEDFMYQFIQLMSEEQQGAVRKKIAAVSAALNKIHNKPAKSQATCFASP